MKQASTLVTLMGDGLKHKTLPSALAALDDWDLNHLIRRTASITTEVPAFENFVRSLTEWEHARRTGGCLPAFPGEGELVRSGDLYCDDAIADAYEQIFRDTPDFRGGIEELLETVIVLCGESATALGVDCPTVPTRH